MKNDFCKLVVMESPVGYGYHRIILDENGKPVDYELIEANSAFEKLTGLKLKQVKGRKVSEFLPGISESKFDWIGIYGEVALTGKSKEFEQYSEQLKKWFRVKVHSIEKFYFGTYFFDISSEKYLEEAAEYFLQNSSKEIDFQKITDQIIEITGAKYSIFNLYNESGTKYHSVAVSGLNDMAGKISSFLGFNIREKQWDHDFEKAKKIKGRIVTEFNTLHDLSGDTIPKSVIMILEKTFRLGKTYVAAIVKDNITVGDFTLIFEKGAELENQNFLELYTRLTGQFIFRKKIEDQMLKSREQYVLAVKGSRDGIWDWDIKTGDLFLSPRWKNIIGYSDDELSNKLEVFHSLLHDDDKSRVLEYMDRYLKGAFEHYNIEFRMKHKDGSFRWIHARGEALLDEKGVPCRMAGSHSDITEKKEMEKRLETFATIDDLTGLWNRRYFFEIGKKECSRARRYKMPFSLFMLDIDFFKKVNDTHGHACGDKVLQNVSLLIKKSLRDIDIAARIGGEEFGILLPGTDKLNAVCVADRIRKVIAENPVDYEGMKYQLLSV